MKNDARRTMDVAALPFYEQAYVLLARADKVSFRIKKGKTEATLAFTTYLVGIKAYLNTHDNKWYVYRNNGEFLCERTAPAGVTKALCDVLTKERLLRSDATIVCNQIRGVSNEKKKGSTVKGCFLMKKAATR